MKRGNSMMFVLLATLVLLPQAGLAQSDNETEYECACNLDCQWNYFILNPTCFGDTGTITVYYDGSIDAQPSYEQSCESQDYANQICIRGTPGKLIDALNEKKAEICPDAIGPLGATFAFERTSVTCDFREKGCSSSLVLGPDNPRLDTLRRLRDEVLSKTIVGRMLIQIYYDYDYLLTDLFEAHPAAKAQVKEALASLIDRIEPLL